MQCTGPSILQASLNSNDITKHIFLIFLHFRTLITIYPHLQSNVQMSGITVIVWGKLQMFVNYFEMDHYQILLSFFHSLL